MTTMSKEYNNAYMRNYMEKRSAEKTALTRLLCAKLAVAIEGAMIPMQVEILAGWDEIYDLIEDWDDYPRKQKMLHAVREFGHEFGLSLPGADIQGVVMRREA